MAHSIAIDKTENLTFSARQTCVSHSYCTDLTNRCSFDIGHNCSGLNLPFGLQGPFPNYISACEEDKCWNIFRRDLFRLQASSSDRWLLHIHEYEEFYKTVELIYGQFEDLARRMNLLHTQLIVIGHRFGNEEDLVAPLENDIKRLSELGMVLATATKNYLENVRKQMVKIEVAQVRAEALNKFKSLNLELENAKLKQNASLDESIELLSKALQELDKAVKR